MYESYFDLNETPFSISPDPRFFYLTSQHKEALAKAQYAITQRMGLSVIYGDWGTGKTTLARILYQKFREANDHQVAMIVNPELKTDTALLRKILAEFGVPPKRSHALSLENFQSFVTDQYAKDKNLVLMIDEAQTVNKNMLELFRSLLNFEEPPQKFLQIVLFGMNELATKLDLKAELKSRVTMFGALSSLTREDMDQMIQFRYTVAGGKQHPFSKEALDVIFRRSRGLPREICKICNESLTKAFVTQKKTVDKELAVAAADELRITEEKKRDEEKKEKETATKEKKAKSRKKSKK